MLCFLCGRLMIDLLVHHAENISLTTHFANFLKGDDILMMLASRSDSLKSKAKAAFLPDIELAFGHYTRIRLVIPHSKDNRIALANDQNKDCISRRLDQMCTELIRYETISR
ncbi:hypothetical protein HBH64_020940 [Parastagonospora nodorum]|nr:hypothetical protein HBH53_220380 [Parastagonospora nodorum]KAH4234969.1 hypothetical protein HBI06_063020 [Parastagonospora nodorum]KAH4250195.1 hypothetical protein HBI05_015220 [Parastagonospora nodorum]KAH4285129.1 hypothetical protein HBI02_237140 [Parastagonospora nodorum]KAH4290620.1 hypothetical protein HBI01_198610 [Parastagonospora nodorum]